MVNVSRFRGGDAISCVSTWNDDRCLILLLTKRGWKGKRYLTF
jgi:hypothetical protein